ncbi:MAG: peptidoglycan DD-metalloendopeptidase family protein [Candidatus Cloacimonadia bacterium]
MKRLFLLTTLLLFLLPGFLFSQTDLKAKRLEYLDKAIEEKDQEIHKTQEELKKLDKNKSETDQKYKANLQQLRSLSEQEKKAIKQLNEYSQRANQTESYLQKASSLWQKQIVALYFNQYEKSTLKDKIINDHYLPQMIMQSNNQIDLNKKLLTLIKTDIQQTTQTKQTIASNQKRAESSKELLSKDISRIQKEIKELSEEEKRIAKERQELENNRIALENLITMLQSDQQYDEQKYLFTMPKLIWPNKGRVVKHFGHHKDDTYNFITINNGIDIDCEKSTEVVAIDFGVVIFAERFRNYGRMIILDHQNGFLSLYSNLSKILVTKNDQVELGQPIAVAGKRQDSDQYFLHFELRRDNEAVDPLKYLQN